MHNLFYADGASLAGRVFGGLGFEQTFFGQESKPKRGLMTKPSVMGGY